jgi:hypothetical protein
MANHRRKRPRKQPQSCLCCGWWRWQGNKAARKSHRDHKKVLSAQQQIDEFDPFEVDEYDLEAPCSEYPDHWGYYYDWLEQQEKDETEAA